MNSEVSKCLKGRHEKNRGVTGRCMTAPCMPVHCEMLQGMALRWIVGFLCGSDWF